MEKRIVRKFNSVCKVDLRMFDIRRFSVLVKIYKKALRMVV